MVESVRYNKYAPAFIISVGVACMIVAGYFLIEGLSQFSGDATTRNILIIGGILFQVAESLCFVAAAALAFHSRLWRVSMFMLGCVLFLFSVAVMTLAQKTALQSGINEASAIDEKRQYMREQLGSLDRMIESYQDNAEKQSRSIYKDSRALGQDSINRATEIEQKKLELSDQLFALNQQRKETSVDFFNRLQEVTGLPARNTEFYFLVLRSLLIELCGILLMAFGASLRAFAVRNNPQPMLLAATSGSGHNRSKAGKFNNVVNDSTIIESGVTSNPKSISNSIRKKEKIADKRESSAAKISQKAIAKASALIRKSPAKEAQFTQKPLLAETTDTIEEFDVDAVDLDAEIQFIEDHPNAEEYTEHSYSEHIQRLRDTTTATSGQQQAQPKPAIASAKEQGNSIIDLYQKGVISRLNREEIINGLRKYNKIDVDKALDLQIENFVSQESESVKS